jgi:DNA-directed RNA polymerase subunit RPC12/RpoP
MNLFKECIECKIEFNAKQETDTLCPRCSYNRLPKNELWHHHYVYQPVSKEAIKEVYSEFNIMD